jgi:hypothetical protein
LGGAAVIRALYDLQGQDGPRTTYATAERIASYLKADVQLVLPILRDLKDRRLFTDRQRRGERVWMPWREA